MRSDLILGVFLSAFIHGGIFFGEMLIKFEPKPKPVALEAPKVLLMEMPKLEPDEPEKVEATDEPIKPMDLAPPMLTDVPQIVTDTSFVQKVQPPPPEGMRPAVGVVPAKLCMIIMLFPG